MVRKTGNATKIDATKPDTQIPAKSVLPPLRWRAMGINFRQLAILNTTVGAITVVMIISTGLLWRQGVVTSLPGLKPVYDHFGLTFRSIDVDKINVTRLRQGDREYLKIIGQIVNPSDQAVALTPLNISLYDQNNSKIYNWLYVPAMPDGKVLAPDQKLEFSSMSQALPPGAVKVTMNFD